MPAQLDPPSFNALLYAAIGGLTVTIASGVITIITGILTRRSEERKHLRELIVKTSVENWTFTNQKLAEAKQSPIPIEAFIIQATALFNGIKGQSRFGPKKAAELMRESLMMRDACDKANQQFSQDKYDKKI